MVQVCDLLHTLGECQTSIQLDFNSKEGPLLREKIYGNSQWLFVKHVQCGYQSVSAEHLQNKSNIWGEAFCLCVPKGRGLG